MWRANRLAIAGSRMETVLSLLLFTLLLAQHTPLTLSISEEVSTNDSRYTLFLLTLIPYPDTRPNLQPSWDGGPDVIPAMELAVEHINAREDILSEYKLELINEDGGCNIPSKALIGFVRQIFHLKQQIVGIVGPSCSGSTLAASPLSSQNEVSLINIHFGGSCPLANRSLYPFSFSISGSSLQYIDTIFGLMHLNDWRFITVLYDESRVFFYTTFLKLENLFPERVPGNDSEISFSSPVSFTHIPLRTIQDTGIRITFILSGPEYARWIMCLAYYENMLYPMHQWIMFNRELSEFEDTLFYYDRRKYNCTRNLFENTILNGVIFVNYRLNATQHDIVSAQTGYSFDMFWELYKEKITSFNVDQAVPQNNITTSVWATTYYDAVWTLALALNSSGVNLTDYRFNHSNVTEQIRAHIHDLDFDGVSGHINYDNETGFTTRLIDIHQVFNATEHLVAHSDEGNITEMPEADPQFVPNFFITIVADRHIHLAVGVLFMAIITVELVFVIGAHIISIVYRKYKSIKAASPKLNHLIYVGCYVTIAITLIYLLIKISNFDDETTGAICHANWAWLFPVGYTLVFGTIAARTWRLYRIFTHYLDPGSFISDPVLFAFVFILLFIDIIYAIIWTAIDPIHTEYDEAISTDSDTLERSQRCTSHHYVWYLILVGNKSLLLLVVGTLSLLTRNITNKTYSTHDLRVGVYLLIITIVIGIPLFIIFSLPQINYHADVVVLSLEAEAIILLLLVFILFPPLVPLLKEKYLHVQQHKYLQITRTRCSEFS